MSRPNIDKNPATRFREHEFTRISSNEWYSPGENDRSRTLVRDEFIAGASDDPAIEYSRIHSIDYVAIEQEYFQVLEAARDAADDVLYESAARKLAELFRHKEVRRRLGGEAIDKALSTRRAESMNEEIFGEVAQQDFNAVFSRVLEKAEALADTLPEARELLELSGEKVELSQEAFDFELHKETLDRLKEDLFDIIPGLEGSLAPHEDRNVDAAEAAEWGQKILDATEMTRAGWRTAVVAGKAASTSKKDKRLNYGEERVFESTTKMNATNVHEAIGHAFRSHNADLQEDYRLRGAMPDTLAAEEGGATVLEQLIVGQARQVGQRYLLALGLGKGLDRHTESRSFRQTYDILYRSIVVEQATEGKEIDVLSAQRKAFQECMRTRRGGALDARDISYFNGAKKVNPWFNQIARLPAEKRKESLRIFLSGQFDPTNLEQAALFGLETAA